MRAFISAGAGLFLAVHLAAAPAPLAPIRTIPLPHVEGRIDHLAVDAARRSLFVTALGSNTVEVVDLSRGTHVTRLTGFREPQGIAVAVDTGMIGVANGKGAGLQLLRADDYRPARMVPLGDDSDNVRYDPPAKRFYVGFGDGALAAVDSGVGRVLAEAKLPGHPESFQLEQAGFRIFVNVPTVDEIAVVDRRTMAVTATWPVVGARSNFPMALDETRHQLLVGCRSPARMLVYDTTTGKEVDSVAIVGDTDDLFYDAARQRVYVSGGEGYVDVLQRENGARFQRIERVTTASGARTSLFVPGENLYYLAVPHRGGQQAEIRVYQAQ